ncbi:MAG: hypothetical protein NTW86_29455 [Candidatus Sumerlaeota bacterium]|nr:hypothetical protein [Candidatus Sumerlaeota bacterium]
MHLSISYRLNSAVVILAFAGAVAGFAAEVNPAQTKPVPAFPGAEGAGATATGGRGGTVVHVTNLNPSGPGSLADAVSQPNRIVVFDVSGAIDLLQEKGAKDAKTDTAEAAETPKNAADRLAKKEEEYKKTISDPKTLEKKLKRREDEAKNRAEHPDLAPKAAGRTLSINQPNITLAGQTAPGEGIALIHGSLAVKASNVIVRHIRVRRGAIAPGNMGDGITVKGDDEQNPLRDVILDHVSTCWTTDENITMTSKIANGTVQYAIAAEGLDYFNPPQTPPKHSEGSLFGSGMPDGVVNFHHMIYAHNRLRNPRFTGGGETPVIDLRNSVIYNGKETMTQTGSGGARGNLINNYYKFGIDTFEPLRGGIMTFCNKTEPFQLYAAGNYVDGYPEATADNWLAMRYDKENRREPDDKPVVRATEPFPMAPMIMQTAQEAYETCLAESGATLPSRDWIDHRIATDVRFGTGRIIDTETDLPEKFRWCTYESLPAPEDTDRDGMPDFWEEQFGLDKAKDDSAADADGDGYTNVEEYLNSTDPKGGAEPVVYIHASVSRADGYDLIPGEFMVERAGKTDGELVVKYSVGGAAKPKDDYEPLSGEVRIGAGQKNAGILVVPTRQKMEVETEMRATAAKGDRPVVVTLEGGAGYHIGCPRAALVTIKPY